MFLETGIPKFLVLLLIFLVQFDSPINTMSKNWKYFFYYVFLVDLKVCNSILN